MVSALEIGMPANPSSGASAAHAARRRRGTKQAKPRARLSEHHAETGARQPPRQKSWPCGEACRRRSWFDILGSCGRSQDKDFPTAQACEAKVPKRQHDDSQSSCGRHTRCEPPASQNWDSPRLSARGGRWDSGLSANARREYTDSRQAHVAITGYSSNRLTVEQLRKRSLLFWNRTPTRNPL